MHLNREKIFRLLTGIIFIVFIAIIVISHKATKKENSSEKIIPIISADSSPIKIKPDEEGGIEIPFKNTKIYNSVEEVKDDTETSSIAINKEENNEVIKDVDTLINSLTEEESKEEKIIVENKVVSKNYRAQLGSLKTEEQAKTAWDKLSKANPSLLGELSLHIEKAETSKGIYYRVQTSLISKSESENICAKLGNCLTKKSK